MRRATALTVAPSRPNVTYMGCQMLRVPHVDGASITSALEMYQPNDSRLEGIVHCTRKFGPPSRLRSFLLE